MGFFKRMLGVEKLEKKVKKEIEHLEKNLKTSWNWINYLHELEQDNKSKIKQLMQENEELKELIKERNLKAIKEPTKEAKKGKEEKKEKKKVPEQKKPANSNLNLKKVDISGIGKKESYVIQILYQLACFDSSSSITTTKVFENLPYKITKRGLRKKLYKLEEKGIIGSMMYGNSRRWFLEMNKLAKLKQFLARRAA